MSVCLWAGLVTFLNKYKAEVMILSHKKFIGKCKNNFFKNWKQLKPICYVIWGFSKWVNVKKTKTVIKKKSCTNRHCMLLLLIFKADILYEFVVCWSGHKGWLVSSNFSLMSLGKCFRPHSRWRTSYRAVLQNCLHARVFMIHTSPLAYSLADAVKKKSPAPLGMRRG